MKASEFVVTLRIRLEGKATAFEVLNALEGQWQHTYQDIGFLPDEHPASLKSVTATVSVPGGPTPIFIPERRF